MWVWIVIGFGSFLGLSLLVALALARVLGTIGWQVSELYETEAWATRPLARTRDDVGERHSPDRRATGQKRASRTGARPSKRSGSGLNACGLLGQPRQEEKPA